MVNVTVSSKYQIVLPKDIRDSLSIKPGDKLDVVERKGILHLVPLRGIKSLRGFAKGCTFKGLRDETERFDERFMQPNCSTPPKGKKCIQKH